MYLLSKASLELLSHPDEMNQRFGPCLLHDVCPMGLDG